MTEDKTISCRTCRLPFVWTAAQQDRYAARDWVPPKRCDKCREMERQQREGDWVPGGR